MNDDVKRRCENSFYSELYHFDETSQDLVIDKTTGRVMIRKVLDNYDINVFDWLKDNSNIHIPAVYSFYEENDQLTVFEEYIQGDTLDSILKKVNIDYQEKIRIIFDICDALIFLHSAPTPIIHRDIKALNIMLTNDRIVKLVDFDASKTFHPGKNKDTTLIGTVGSAAPEQYGFRQSDARTDIYSMGILIKELFPNDKRFNKIIGKATQMEPKLRYQSVAEMKKTIEKEICPSVKKYRFGPIFFMCFIVCAGFVVFYASKHISDHNKVSNAPAPFQVQNDRENLVSESDSLADNYSENNTLSPSLENTDINTSSGRSNNSEKVRNSYLLSKEGTIDINNSVKIGLTIDESSWYMTPDSYSNGVYIHYAAMISNNSGTAVEYPGIRVTAKNNENTVLGTDNMTGSCIMPGDRIILNNFISAADCNASDVSDVIFAICNGDPDSSLSSATSNDFIITGVKEHKDAFFPNVTGEITSKYSENMSTISISAVFRNKRKLVAAETTYINDLHPNTPTAFQFNILSDVPEYDSVEVVAKPW